MHEAVNESMTEVGKRVFFSWTQFDGTKLMKCLGHEAKSPQNNKLRSHDNLVEMKGITITLIKFELLSNPYL